MSSLLPVPAQMASATPRAPKPSARRFDSLEQEVFLNLWRTYDRLRALEEQLFAAYDLTPQQYNVLRLLRAERPRAMATLSIAGRLVSRAPDITRMLDKLEQRGLVRRERPAENRRLVRVTITAAGLGLLRDTRSAVRRLHARQLGHLGRGQLDQLARLLREARRPHEGSDSSWR
jgi:DNA-binding MarR family transcriptional regulator